VPGLGCGGCPVDYCDRSYTMGAWQRTCKVDVVVTETRAGRQPETRQKLKVATALIEFGNELSKGSFTDCPTTHPLLLASSHRAGISGTPL